MCVRGWRVLSISSRRVPKALRAAKQLQGIQGIQGLQGGRHLFRGWDSSNSRWESFESPLAHCQQDRPVNPGSKVTLGSVVVSLCVQSPLTSVPVQSSPVVPVRAADRAGRASARPPEGKAGDLGNWGATQ